jgi:hypothetical protein
MKTVLLANKLRAEIERIFGDFNDERRNKADLRNFLDVGQEVRVGRRGNYGKWQIVKVGKKSFDVSPATGVTAAVVTFIVNKSGQTYEKGKTNERFGYHYDVDFDCEKIDARMARNAANEEKADSAIEMGRAIASEINRLTPFSRTYTVSDENIEKLKQIKAILGL